MERLSTERTPLGKPTKRKSIGYDDFSNGISIRLDGSSKSNSESENLWPDDTHCGDSIFSEITACSDCEDEEEEAVDELNVQCTQRFIEDILGHGINNAFDTSISPEGSQYTTKVELRAQSLFDKNISLRREVQLMKNLSWGTQDLNETKESFPTKGPFYGLPVNIEKLIYEHKGIKDLYDWQKECLQLPAIEHRDNLIYALPTSGGKTLVAEILMLRELICREKNVLFVLPYVSIVQEKVSAMAPFALNCDFLVEEYTAGKGRCPPPKRRKNKSLYIASIEKAAILFDSLIEANRANEVGLIVIDELHLLGEKGRGATLETLLTKAMFIKAGIQIVGMSATIGNLSELSKFLSADVYTRGFRPVELKEYIKCGNDILQINANGQEISEIFTHCRTVDFKYSSEISKADPDHLAGLVSEVIPKESCLVFCSSRKNCENVAVLLSKILRKDVYLEHKKKDKVALMKALEDMCGTLSPVLRQTIPCGIAYHHSGLMTDERKLLEIAYRLGTLSVICCTSTLAAGVNLPAKRVIIRAPYVGKDFMTLCKYKQMVGRAGRAGMGGTGESILICPSKDNYMVGQMLFSPMNEVDSSMGDFDAFGLETIVLSSIGLRIADCLKELLELGSNTLLAVQANRFEISLEKKITSIIRTMFRHKILEVPNVKTLSDTSNNDIVTTQEVRENSTQHKNSTKCYILSKSTKFTLSMVGKAAFKAGVDYKRAEAIYKELRNAQKCLFLRNFAHLLYLIITYASNDDFLSVDAGIFFREYNKLGEDTQILFRTVGVSDVHIIKMFKTMSIKGPVEDKLSRLFKVLILIDFLELVPVHIIAIKYCIERGMVQNLVSQAVASSSSIVRLCEEIEEFWCFVPLFQKLCTKLDYSCSAELIPLLDLPNVKLGRAKQLYAAGFKTIEDIAKVKPKDLVQSVEYLPFRQAKEIVSAAKVNLLNKLDILQQETEAIMNCFQ